MTGIVADQAGKLVQRLPLSVHRLAELRRKRLLAPPLGSLRLSECFSQRLALLHVKFEEREGQVGEDGRSHGADLCLGAGSPVGPPGLNLLQLQSQNANRPPLYGATEQPKECWDSARSRLNVAKADLADLADADLLEVGGAVQDLPHQGVRSEDGIGIGVSLHLDPLAEDTLCFDPPAPRDAPGHDGLERCPGARLACWRQVAPHAIHGHVVAEPLLCKPNDRTILAVSQQAEECAHGTVLEPILPGLEVVLEGLGRAGSDSIVGDGLPPADRLVAVELEAGAEVRHQAVTARHAGR